MDARDSWDRFFGPNAGYAQELYERYLQDPSSVDAATRAFFDRASPPPPPDLATPTSPPAPLPRREGSQATAASAGELTDREIRLAVGTAKLARMIRTYGHLLAHLDPLGTPPPGSRMLTPAEHGLTEEIGRAHV